jgi:uncharacterized protein (TIGR00255 family)
MLAAEEVAIESVHEACLLLLQQTAQELNRVRGREGEKLKSMVAERIHQVELLVGEVMPHIPRLVATYQERLQTRLAEAGLNGDDDRIRQEISLFAQRIDVDEEISRLKAHVGEVKRVLQDGGVVGKRLDFLMQELNREANTLGAKSASGEVSRISMEMKVLIEQMREQIQNIE